VPGYGKNVRKLPSTRRMRKTVFRKAKKPKRTIRGTDRAKERDQLKIEHHLMHRGTEEKELDRCPMPVKGKMQNTKSLPCTESVKTRIQTRLGSCWEETKP